MHNAEGFLQKNAKEAQLKSLQAEIGTWEVAGHMITPSVLPSDPPVKNLGVTWSPSNDVFGLHVDALLTAHARGMQVVLPLANTAPFPLLKQAYYTYALSAWTHSVGLIIGLQPGAESRSWIKHTLPA